MAKKKECKEQAQIQNPEKLLTISREILETMKAIEGELICNINKKYNYAGAQRVRVASIHLTRILKDYRKESLVYAKKKPKIELPQVCTKGKGKNAKSKCA